LIRRKSPVKSMILVMLELYALPTINIPPRRHAAPRFLRAGARAASACEEVAEHGAA
jgi:hypothetical protein